MSGGHGEAGAVRRVALIHALRHSAAPIEAAFASLWPSARLMTVMDDSLSGDLAARGALDEAMTGRFLALARYAAGAGAEGILFTCSAFGPCIDACREALAPLPVLKPNEAMVEEAVAMGGRIGLLASFGPSLESLPAEFDAARPGVEVRTALARGALNALDAGDGARHDRLAAEAAGALSECAVVALAQFSLARAAGAVAAATGRPVLTTPESAVRKLRRVLGAG